MRTSVYSKKLFNLISLQKLRKRSECQIHTCAHLINFLLDYVGFISAFHLKLLGNATILVFLGLIIVIDIEHHAILIETSILGIVLFFIYGWFLQGVLFTVIGGVAGFLIMFLIYLFGLVFSKGLGKIRKKEVGEEGMGFGDVYAGAFLGLFTGWPYVIGMIIIAILASGIFSFIYILIKSFRKDYQLASTIPYAPFLILGALAVNYIPPLPL